MRRTVFTLSLASIALAGCSDPVSDPAGSTGAAVNASLFGGPHDRDGGVTVFWNGVARDLVIKYKSNAFQAIRGYAVLSVAQYQGIMAAGKSGSAEGHSRSRAAVSGASAVALTYLYPAEAAALEGTVDSLRLASPDQGPDGAKAEAAGRAAAQLVVDSAKTDRFFTPWTGTVPTGPGLWFSTANPPAPPVGVLFGKARPYFLRSGDQFRPPPPPVFGSPEYLSALAEVRQISDTRTAEQDSIAKFWALAAGTYAPAGYWNAEAAGLIGRYHLRERDGARVFAMINMVGFDAIIATHDAKYTYWFIRPTQADPGIKLSVALPNFPSYPSNHAALSSGMAKVLGAFFPGESSRLNGLADQAAMSRLYAGIHYRFDDDTGLRLGRTVAAWALSQARCRSHDDWRDDDDRRGNLADSAPCIDIVERDHR